ncbi:effector-associated domain 2-containing protein [Candidatus Chloroploca asiatica]|uniref:Effector-associated domain-containing protein n=1 Tax=Candidatus Chloroploca asiatica TaxID=1506545 RepID=A0A2H3L5R1_9CHLR|nr:hypothetical protein [Candidatus Chloroploca asiatica]PDW00285.1 hypothetical protein A9Q02_21900 [Candidatus Chloroploca asiatica]
MSSDDRVHLEELLRTYRRRLQVLELQAAQFGIYAPPHITIEIDDLKVHIQDTEMKLGSAGRSVPAARENGTLSTQQFQQLTERFLALPSLSTRSSRDAVVQQLPSHITNAISRHDSAKVDVVNIIRTVLNYKEGLKLLVNAVRFFDDGTEQLQALEAFLRKTNLAWY